MSQSDLSPDVRHRLWQCYSLLLSLAEEAEENTANTELGEGQELATQDQVNQLTQPTDDVLTLKRKQLATED